MSGAYLLPMWDRIQRLPKHGSNLRRKLTPPENKTVQAWLPKADKLLMREITPQVLFWPKVKTQASCLNNTVSSQRKKKKKKKKPHKSKPLARVNLDGQGAIWFLKNHHSLLNFHHSSLYKSSLITENTTTS